jgi:hypothetical protein
MGTHSRIGKLLPNGKVKSIYCHYDGYLHGGVGEDLINHYQDEEKVDALLELGNLSGLGKEIGQKQDFNDFPRQNPDWCLAYGRDRGEKNQEAKEVSLNEYETNLNWEYIYLYKEGKWHFVDSNQYRYSGWQDLAETLSRK